MGVIKQTVLCVGATLPVAAYQNLTAALSTRGSDATARLHSDIVTRKNDASTHAGHAASADAATIAHHTALKLPRRHRRKDDQPALGFNRLTVVNKRLPLTSFDTNVSELVVRVQL